MMIQILAGVGLFFLGIMVGAVCHRSFQGETSKNKRLEQKLAELQDTHSRYQAEVSEHFMDTAKAVQTLNKSYRDVHTQLAKGASKLCNDDHSDDFLSINFSPDNTNTQTKDNTPPMDYAPKDRPDAEGTLSERYGLEDSDFPDTNLNEQTSQEALQESKPVYEESEVAEKEQNHKPVQQGAEQTKPI
ncbi:MAG: uncharacterized membrane-anchored protein YhcB (DUF1043 family) [Pseudohongiellaceae bacterium]|jgi:uncharacterized membrane-anchored protein YhcB (DUF1043 family)